ncbi:hypothetical protein DY023_04915 [Microbacterium bovistercoris]|uniref:Uncharacterized protein n=1 Tax=Microbacterium bovistercoris TaxID=2293570 RepID=A0A371NXI1_9MICO|nr:hypothetical protein [Microbacterium bovistercoris]REJ06915.1 hypothetical protein DY023_04915 [Microbacterium bovistercoris]
MGILSETGRHEIEVVEGNGDDIEARGNQIVHLARALDGAADTIDRILSDGATMKGHSIEKLREEAEKIQSEIRLAATLYEKAGPIFQNYGSALSDAKRGMSDLNHVTNAESAWRNYQEALGAYQSAQSTPVNYPDAADHADDPQGLEDARTEAENTHGEAVDTARTAKNAAFDLWEEASDLFDADWKTWDEAYDAALTAYSGIEDHKLKDSTLDNLDGLVDFVMGVLSVVGVVIAVLAIVVGGPIIAIAGLVVGVLALVGTLYQSWRSEGGFGMEDIIPITIAVIGVIPFGSIGEFATGGFGAGMRSWVGLGRGGMSLGDDAARWSLAAPDMLNPRQWASTMRSLEPGAGFVTGGDDLLRTLMGGHDDLMTQAIGELATMGEQAAYAFGSVGTHINNIASTWGGLDSAWKIVTNPDRILHPTW